MLRGAIWWIDFGVPKGSEMGGRHLALIVQNNTGNAHSSTVIVAAMTSKQKKPYPFHVEFTARETGLKDDGTVLLEQLHTFSKDRLLKREGTFPSARMKEIDVALEVSLGLNRGMTVIK